MVDAAVVGGVEGLCRPQTGGLPVAGQQLTVQRMDLGKARDGKAKAALALLDRSGAGVPEALDPNPCGCVGEPDRTRDRGVDLEKGVDVALGGSSTDLSKDLSGIANGF